ncbi:MAG: sigma-70 family RNA polymerase sigma factor [Candidatus Paceibacterota bacterium]|jgi:RNA polymerase sigma factor (sigma-70 family)
MHLVEKTVVENNASEPMPEAVGDIAKEILKELTLEVAAPVEPGRIDKIYFEYAANKTTALRNEIVAKNRALVTFIVSKFYNSKKEHKMFREDLLQEGCIGLMAAIDGYKPELGYKFSTYATWWIRQAVNNYLLNVEPIIHIPSHVRTANNKLSRRLREENVLYQDFIEGYKDAEYSKKMIDSIVCAIRTKNVRSFDEPIKSSGGQDSEAPMTLKDIISSTNPSLESVVDNAFLVESVKKSLLKLSDKEKYILLLRFDVINEVPKKVSL